MIDPFIQLCSFFILPPLQTKMRVGMCIRRTAHCKTKTKLEHSHVEKLHLRCCSLKRKDISDFKQGETLDLVLNTSHLSEPCGATLAEHVPCLTWRCANPHTHQFDLLSPASHKNGTAANELRAPLKPNCPCLVPSDKGLLLSDSAFISLSVTANAATVVWC